MQKNHFVHHMLIVVWVILISSSNAQVARAGFIISFGNAFIPAGGSSSVDVFIRSNQAGGDNLNLLSCLFEISAAAPGTTGIAQFSSSQLASERTDGSYVFANDLGTDGFSSVRQDPNFKTQVIQSDFSFSAVGTKITNPQLLGRLEIEQISAGATGTFRISLKEDGNTFFFNSGGLAEIDQVSYSNFGTLTSSITAVPEPASCLLCGLALAAFAIRRFRSNRTIE